MNGPVYTSDPINWDHPLNRSKAAWFYGLPPTDGGRQWFDLCGKNHGVLTSTAKWVPTPLYGSGVRLDGSSYVSTGSAVLPASPVGITIAAWAKPTTLSGPHRLVTQENFNNAGWNIYSLYITGSQWAFSIGSGTSGTITTFFAATANVWTRVVGTWDGSTVRLHTSGVQRASTAYSGSLPSPSATRGVQIGRFSSAFLEGYFGDLADIQIAGRAWSASEVAADYELSCREYPEVFNRVGPSVFILSNQDIVSQGGSTVGGSATTWVVGSFSSTAGSLASGASQTAASYLPTPSGIALVNGAGQSNTVYQPVIAGGGSAGGTAFQIFADTVEVAGGCTTSGNSSATVVYIVPTLGGAGCSGSAQLGIGVTASGGARSGGSAISTLIFQPVAQGGVRGAGQALNFSTFSERATGGASAAGVAYFGSVVSPVVAGGIHLNGSARLTFNDTFEVSGGTIANGSSHAGASYFFSSTGGALVRGYALQLIGVSNPTRITYHRFRIGDLVYVPSPVGDRYLRAAIQSIYSYNEFDYYEVGLGWFPDRMLLSYQQYRAWLRRRR